jgi:hypothetical protein
MHPLADEHCLRSRDCQPDSLSNDWRCNGFRDHGDDLPGVWIIRRFCVATLPAIVLVPFLLFGLTFSSCFGVLFFAFSRGLVRTTGAALTPDKRFLEALQFHQMAKARAGSSGCRVVIGCRHFCTKREYSSSTHALLLPEIPTRWSVCEFQIHEKRVRDICRFHMLADSANISAIGRQCIFRSEIRLTRGRQDN